VEVELDGLDPIRPELGSSALPLPPVSAGQHQVRIGGFEELVRQETPEHAVSASDQDPGARPHAADERSAAVLVYSFDVVVVRGNAS